MCLDVKIILKERKSAEKKLCVGLLCMKKEFTGDSDRIVHIYDRMFKKILTLSARAVIGLINGLFGTEYPPDSTITYNWTEHHD